MKNALVLLALLVVAPLVSQARPFKLVCTSVRGATTLNLKTENCRSIVLKADNVVDRLFCGLNSKWDSSNQVFVSVQDNGLSSLSQVDFYPTGRVDIPTQEVSNDTRNVTCRLSR